MSLNKTRKRLIRKYRGSYNSRLLGLKIKTASVNIPKKGFQKMKNILFGKGVW
nr:MAG TPA: hypothetical protein [Caudoviricetes sp.]